MPDILYTKTVDLPRPMTGLMIKEALEKSAGKDFRNGCSVWDEDQKSLSIGAQPDSYPYGLTVTADKNGTLLGENETYQQIVVRSNDGWGGIVYACICSDDDVIGFCQDIIKKFLESLK
ncbi:MAG: hypothetical protein UX47_C0007G0080 [Candidatus Collierbacteria bacterium GW2011_GWA2_46_26]|uniref:Uncharacterized protein n=1 Tax=Candidatus Collierbacteria bacterium GW2011_GWA2_46_26 TaxID=1618381 RepID=A0A0G1PJB1_9BACT|nr:MAG: hypothetical protein UW29_C0006G0050 [Candidatus Collierbacteria bacterium GW2011_GWC2_44_13]KKU32836.1 MAG: hypothetical protein UX47_C0007G0080 [Candidatus Collierbacteria bacterium GW2011_GWA2_46_26]